MTINHDDTRFISAGIMLASGQLFDPLNPRVDDFEIDDIAHGLALCNRFAGHTLRPWSVAQHCLHVASLLPGPLKVHGLLHDAAEGLGLLDMPTPVKVHLHRYVQAEIDILGVVYQKLRLPIPTADEQEAIHHADKLSFIQEASFLMHPCMTFEATWGYPEAIEPDPFMSKELGVDLHGGSGTHHVWWEAKDRWLEALTTYLGLRH